MYVCMYVCVCMYGFNIVPSYSMVATSSNMMFGVIGLLVISIFDVGSLVWFNCPTFSVICLPYQLNFLTLFVGG